MITNKKAKLLFALAAICICSIVNGQQTENPKKQLWFEIVTEFIRIPEDFPEVKYVGHIHIVEDRDLRPWWIEAIQTTSKWKQMSDQQQQFILKLQNDYRYHSIAEKKQTSYPFVENSIYVKTKIACSWDIERLDSLKVSYTNALLRIKVFCFVHKEEQVSSYQRKTNTR